MFVFREESLPKDPVFPADLKQLGYFVTENDQIKMVEHPERDFLYKISSNDRINEMQKEAMNTCIREIVLSRLHDLGLEKLRLPIGAPPTSQHVPILTTPSLETQSRVIVVFGEPEQDLGIWAYRTVGREKINTGSAVDFAAFVLGKSDTKQSDSGEAAAAAPGLIIANPGQLVWHCGGQRAMSLPTWRALPRRYAVDPPMKMSFSNKIPGNYDWQNHVTYIFEEVLGKIVSPDARIDIIGLAEGGFAAVRYLAEHWPAWKPRISAICLANPLHDFNHLHPSDFANFMSSRSRAYLISPEPLDTPVVGRDHFGCNCYSSGEELNVECIMPKAWRSMVDWLDGMHAEKEAAEIEILREEEIQIKDSVPGETNSENNDEDATAAA